LIDFFECCPGELTEGSARVLAANCVVVADEPVRTRVPIAYILSANLIDDDEGIAYPIAPKTVMRVDGLDIILRHGLPKGWALEKGTVFLDGELLVSRDQYPETRYGNRPREFLLPKDYLKPGRIYGKHKLLSTVTLVAPNGTKIPLERAVDFEVLTEQQERRLLEGSIE
jgi:hypothetical protein